MSRKSITALDTSPKKCMICEIQAAFVANAGILQQKFSGQ
jgi:phosphoribosyl-dephospho-CoA transferase